MNFRFEFFVSVAIALHPLVRADAAEPAPASASEHDLRAELVADERF
jgi:hypothetical protein